MKVKNFDEYLKKRLDNKTIQDIERMAKLEAYVLKSLQKQIANYVKDYMKKEEIGFNELARRLDLSPTQVNKIQKAEANLTLASIAHIFALLKKKPKIVV